MADKHGNKLERLLRVRTLQLNLVRAGEVAANAKLDSESALQQRIAHLAASVAPKADDTGFAASMAAAAYYRDRLHASAVAAENRCANAAAGVERAREATREARRDQSAIEKLIVRAEAQVALKELRAMEGAPAFNRNRHAPC
jgi:predicted NodU family carbamoyl transferase